MSDLFNSQSSESKEEGAGADTDPSASDYQTFDSEPPDLQFQPSENIDDVVAGDAPSASIHQTDDPVLPSSDPDLLCSVSIDDPVLPSSDPDLLCSESIDDVVNPNPTVDQPSSEPDLELSEIIDGVVAADRPSAPIGMVEGLSLLKEPDNLGLDFDRMISIETDFMTSGNFTVDMELRRLAIRSILEVSRRFGFLPLTAWLAINFLNRYLSATVVPTIDQLRLLVVVCLSTAAKSKQTAAEKYIRVRLLTDVTSGHYEVGDLIQMKLRLSSALTWRMEPVTPFVFLGEFAFRLGRGRYMELFSIASRIILHALTDDDFLVYRPSAQAASAIILAAEEIAGKPDTFEHYVPFLSNYFPEGAIGSIRECYELMLPFARRREDEAPSESEDDEAWEYEGETSASGARRGASSSSPSDERDKKRPRLGD